MVVLGRGVWWSWGGVAFAFKRGTLQVLLKHRLGGGAHMAAVLVALGHLAHKKTPTPLGPP